MNAGIAVLLSSVVTLGGAACHDSGAAKVPDTQVIAAVAPHLASFRERIGSFPSTFGACTSPVPDFFPVCQHDQNRLLLLQQLPSSADGVGNRVLGIAYVPDTAGVSHIGSWYVGHLGRPLGHGWYQVYAISGLD